MFLFIALNVILPIFLVMALGFLLARTFPLDLGTLSKLNFHIFIPVFMFHSLLLFDPGGREIAGTVLFNLLLALVSFLAMFLLAKGLRFGPGLSAASTLAVVVFNSANYGIPVVQLAFPGEGVAIQVITITTMNILTYTLGILVSGGWSQWRKGMAAILRLPILYVLGLALLLKGLRLGMPEALMTPLQWVSNGMAPIALLTLGAQLGRGGLSLKRPRDLWVTTGMRLLFGPLAAYLLIVLLGFHGLLAKVLFVSSSFPTAVATVLFGIEYDTEPAFAADVVFVTTLLSALTVTGAISLSAVLF